MKVFQPKNLNDALDLLAANPDIRPIAGGTDLMVDWHHHDKTDWALMDLSPVDDLRQMSIDDDALHLGALTTYWDVIASRDITNAFPLLTRAAKQVGAIQIQTRGTWAGNIANASPAADGVPVLMAYDAVVHLKSKTESVDVPLDRYFTGYKQSVRTPDQLIVGITIPRKPRTHEWFYKVGARSAQAITKVGVAMVHDDTGWHVVVNSVAPCVCRCNAIETALNANRTFNTPNDIASILKNDIAPIDDIRSTAHYRRTVLARLIHARLKQQEQV